MSACVLYFFTTFRVERQGAQREREKKNLVEEDIPSKMEEESSCSLSSPKLLWEVIVKCDDICFTHVLPRLNRTDLNVDRVNGETRALVKRSSRAGDLKEKFKVQEMSSISTLEVAWEHKSLWPRHWTETYFCVKVAKTNKLELLKWARGEKV